MQFLLITKKDTLQSLSKIVGAQNVDLLLAENGLRREPGIGAQWYEKCDTLVEHTLTDVPAARKAALLNSLTDSEEVFEKACLMDEDEWKIFSAFQSFRDTLRVPEAIQLPYSTRVIGSTVSNVSIYSIGNVSGASSRTIGSGLTVDDVTVYNESTPASPISGSGTSSSEPVSSETYRTVMRELNTSGRIDPGVFNKVNTSFPVNLDDLRKSKANTPVPQFAYNLPWGKIQIYSSLLDEVIDIPAYPEELETSRSASYTSMPDIIYQYEPWIVYQSSGPREQQLSFHLHRDMWSGNHLDGNANRLIRFCEANTFPRYNGSIVTSPKIRIYIDGALFVAGVLTNTRTHYAGPIGLDNWYLEFTLDLTIQEVSDTPLSIDTVKDFGIIGQRRG